jgi:hypothetical protein
MVLTEPELVKDSERRGVPAADSGPDALPTGCKCGFENRSGRFGRVALPMHPTNELVCELRFIECHAPNQQTTVTDSIAFDATLNAQEPNAGLQSLTALRGEALLLLSKRKRPTDLLLNFQLQIALSILWTA